MLSKMPSALEQHLAEKMGSALADINPVAGGDISMSAVVSTDKGSTYFVKWNFQAPAGFFSAEARGLNELSQANVIKVPHVAWFAEQAAGVPAFIVLEYLEPASHGVDAERELGAALAALHQVTADQFGFDCDNFIGLTPQRNQKEESWPEFFFQHRIVPQLELGQEQGWVDLGTERLVSTKATLIRELLSEDEAPPSLLHGDLWCGNIHWSSGGPALIDPAVYFGSPEADLAFTELFGGFSDAFYRAYYSLRPMAKGYERRKNVLNLYHLMNHANLFGGSYIGSVKNILSAL